jgi:signal transduction histidine kinase
VRFRIRFSTVAVAAVAGFILGALVLANRALVTTENDRRLQIGIWALGIVTVIALALAVAHERRLTRRMADRSNELERLSAELLRANRTKSEFLANVSHELRTPLNAIVGFVDLMREGFYGELTPRLAAPVQRIEASATHLRELVDQILDLAKMTAGRLEVHSELVELRPFILDVAADVEPLANEKGLVVSLGVGPLPSRLRTDPTHLRQILVNLLGNAVKYTQHGSIALRARVVSGKDVPPTIHRPAPVPARITDGPAATAGATSHGSGWAAIQVSDTGVGIALVDQERIFHEFERVDAGATAGSARRGTGLGLTISRRLARFLGGDITLESEVGKGSTFTVWLPVDAVDLDTAVQPSSSAIHTELPPPTADPAPNASAMSSPITKSASPQPLSPSPNP